MSTALRVLIVEDSEDDLRLLLRELQHGGFKLVYTRVETPEAMSRALEEQEWDLVVSDYLLPRFSGLDALEVLKETKLDVPLIMLSGKMGEEHAVEAMRAGARDYIVKHNLARLVPAIQRELQESALRRELRETESALREGEAFYREQLEESVEIRTADLRRLNRMLLQEIEEHKQAEQQISRSLQEKDILLKEVHHRVNNNLQIIYALLDFQLKGLRDEAAIQVLKESQNRIKSIAMVHDKLYRASDLARLDFGQYAYGLAVGLFKSYGTDPQCVKLRVDAQDITLDVDTALPLGLILNELLSNALRHAFPRQREGTILVEMKENEAELILRVKDDGIGFPPNFPTDQPETLGLQLVNLLTGQLEGHLEVKHKGGTEFRLCLPIQRKGSAGELK